MTHLSKKHIEEDIKNNNFNHINATEYRFYVNENEKIIIPKNFNQMYNMALN